MNTGGSFTDYPEAGNQLAVILQSGKLHTQFQYLEVITQEIIEPEERVWAAEYFRGVDTPEGQTGDKGK